MLPTLMLILVTATVTLLLEQFVPPIRRFAQWPFERRRSKLEEQRQRQVEEEVQHTLAYLMGVSYDLTLGDGQPAQRWRIVDVRPTSYLIGCTIRPDHREHGDERWIALGELDSEEDRRATIKIQHLRSGLSNSIAEPDPRWRRVHVTDLG